MVMQSAPLKIWGGPSENGGTEVWVGRDGETKRLLLQSVFSFAWFWGSHRQAAAYRAVCDCCGQAIQASNVNSLVYAMQGTRPYFVTHKTRSGQQCPGSLIGLSQTVGSCRGDFAAALADALELPADSAAFIQREILARCDTERIAFSVSGLSDIVESANLAKA